MTSRGLTRNQEERESKQKHVESEKVFFLISKHFLHVSYTGMFKQRWEGVRRKDIIDSYFYYYCPSPLGCADPGRQGQGLTPKALAEGVRHFSFSYITLKSRAERRGTWLQD